MNNMNDEEAAPLRICATCAMKHYENCPDCFGFGVRQKLIDGKHVPVVAEEVQNPPEDCIPCPFCGSTTKGIQS